MLELPHNNPSCGSRYEFIYERRCLSSCACGFAECGLLSPASEASVLDGLNGEGEQGCRTAECLSNLYSSLRVRSLRSGILCKNLVLKLHYFKIIQYQSSKNKMLLFSSLKRKCGLMEGGRFWLY